MSEQQIVGQLFMAGNPATGPVSSAISADIATYHTGSVILTGRSSAGVTATRQLTNQLQGLATGSATDGVPLFIATDQEGGNVQVLSGPGFSTMPTALSQGSEPTSELLQNAQTWGSQLVAAGVNLNLAPVLDTVPEDLASTNQPIGIYQREYGYTPAAVTAAGTAFIQGMHNAGEGTVIKHFPGLGRASGNTDTTYGVTDDVTTYDDPYLQPYATAVSSYGVQGVMVSEAIYLLIDPDHQAVFSPTVIGGMLRTELGFQGMIMSDSMEAAAVSELTPAEQAVDFIEAGGDLVLATDPTVIPAMYNAVLAQAQSDPAFATLVDDAATTVLAAKQQIAQTPAITSADQATFGTGVAGSFTVTATGVPWPTFSESGALPAGVTFSSAGVLSGTPAAGTAGSYPIEVSATNSVGTATQAFTLTVDNEEAAYYTPVSPLRVLDTRNGTGGYDAPVGPGGTISLQVTGADGVPASGVTAVVLNVTATDTTASSYVTVYPDGTTRPLASNLNFTAGDTIPNLVTVPVGADGKVDFYNNAGSTDLVADLAGYYASGTGSSYVPDGPIRLLDTRNGTGGYSSPVGPGGTISLQITGNSTGGVPSSGVTAVVLNVTATDTTASSFVTVYPDGTTRPLASNLNFSAGETIPNLVTVPVGADGKVDFYNDAGSTDLVADLAGYYTSSQTTGSAFVALSPVRVLDTRNGTGGYFSPVGSGSTMSVPITGMDGVPATGVTAVVLSVTATDTTASSYVTVYPDDQAQPTASNLNFTAGETIPNLVVVPVGADGIVNFYNDAGSTDLVSDLFGYFLN